MGKASSIAADCISSAVFGSLRESPVNEYACRIAVGDVLTCVSGVSRLLLVVDCDSSLTMVNGIIVLFASILSS